KLWARVVAAQPLAEDAHRAYVLLLAETVGRHAAMEHLHAVCERFPHHLRLTQLLLDWQEEEGPEAVEPIVRKLIEMHPSNAWAWRKLALTLAAQNRLDEAFEALAAAEPLEPASIGYFGVQGELLRQAGRFDEAKEAFRGAVRVSADATYAMNELISVCETHEERLEELTFIEGELLRQVGSGNGLLAFRDLAAGSLESDDLLASLRKALKARPDLWQAWAVVIRQLRFMVQLDDALEIAKAATERFPLLADVWMDLAEVHEARMEQDAEIAALTTAYDINPFWATPLSRLVELYRQREEHGKASALLEAAIARAPLKAVNHAIQARYLWNSGKRHEAFDRMRHTLTLDPEFESAWDNLCEWATELKCFGAVVDLAREQTVKRPGEIRSWMRLAQALHTIPDRPLIDDADLQEECLAALERVLELRPWHIEAHDLKAQVLAEVQRWVEAQEACQDPIWNGRPPIILRGRLAWITYQRGDPEHAVELMAEAVKADREYFWGLRHLAEWYEQLGNFAECLQATERLIALDPYNPVTFVRRAEARRALDDRAGAMADYERAVQLAPDYFYPLFQLFDLHVEDNNTEAARKLLDSADPTEARGDFLLRSLKLAMIEKDKDAAVAALEDLCIQGDDEQLDGGVGAFVEAEMEEEAEDVLHRFLGGGMNVCNQWIQLVTYRTSLDEVRERIENLPPKHLCRLNVTVAYAEALGEAGQADKLHDWVQANEALLRSKTWAWGQIGSCYSKVLDDKRCAAWMHDWQERKDVQPWMLMNLSLAVRGLDRFADGAVINRHVLENYDTDYTSFYHQTWLMLDEALADNIEAVEPFFESHELSELDANHQWVAALARCILMCLKADDKTAVLDEVHESLTEVAAKLDPIDRDWIFELVYRKCIRHMAQICDATGSTWEKLHLLMPILPNLKASNGDAEVHLESLRHALAENDSENALRFLKHVCGTGDEDALKEAVAALEEADLADKAEKVLLRLLVDSPAVCNQWIALAARRTDLEKVAKRISRLPADHLARTNVLIGYAAALAHAKETDLLLAWIEANEDDLHSSTYPWGHIAASLSGVLEHERLIEWMADWQDREDAEPWMLLYLTLAFRSLDRFEEGAEVTEHALGLEEDACSPYHAAWRAFDAALAGDMETTQAFFAEHELDDMDPSHHWVGALARAMLDVAASDDPAESLADIDAALKQTAEDVDPIEPDKAFDLAYVHAIRRIAEICEMSGSKWEKSHLKKPVMPARKE
ncbi:MAG TPA: tetratricopeptide repeat protein, partial [Gemmataceae bacterium]|nr:tetratricopeptide repeat protein [Gemmataceae bacterium]